MNSFYHECKKKSRQMTELILIGIVMTLFVIGSSWGTKIINYYQGPISLDEVTLPKKNEKPHKDSFDRKDPQNQYVEISSDFLRITQLYKNTDSSYDYFIFLKDLETPILIAIDKAESNIVKNQIMKRKTFTLTGGFDVMTSNEKAYIDNLSENVFNGSRTLDISTPLIFRQGNIGDSQMIEITVCIYASIISIMMMFILIILEMSGFYRRKTGKQINALSNEEKQLLDRDFKERLQKNKLSFGDEFLYLSKNWHYEVYKFSDIVLLYYRVCRYGSFNRYILSGWTTEKRHFVISNNLTKEKLERYLQLIYERNSEITVEKTIEKRNIQLYYFKNLVQEMRDRQAINQQLDIVKQDDEIHRFKPSKRKPILLRYQEKTIYQKRKSSRPIHH